MASEGLLYVDSEQGLHEFMRLTLGYRGISPESIIDVYTTDEALTHLHEQSEDHLPRVILFRFGYDDEENRSFLQALRAEESKYKDIPIMIVADRISLDMSIALRSFGVKDVFPYPFDYHQVVDPLVEMLTV